MAPEEKLVSPVSEAEAVRLARELFGIEAKAQGLPGEYDANFHLESGDGAGFVLKVMHPHRERGLVELQCAALAHLAEHAGELALPRVGPTTDGDAFTTAALGGENRLSGC